MAFTAADLTAAETAIRALVAGERTVSVTMEGRTVTYAREDLEALMTYRDRIKQEVDQAAGGSRFRRAVHGRGL